MSTELFRAEVGERQRNSWLGSLSIAQPLALWVPGIVAVLAAIGLVLFLTLADYSRRSRVQGQLVPDLGLVAVVAPSEGVVTRVLVQEGDHVLRGAPIALVSRPRNRANGDDAQSVLREGLQKQMQSARQQGRSAEQQIQTRMAGIAEQVQSARSELRQIQAEIASRGEQIELGEDIVRRYRLIAGEKYVSQVQLKQQEQQVLELRSQQLALQRQASAIQRTVQQLELALRELPQQRSVERATAERDLAVLQGERAVQDADSDLLVKSPVDGVVTSRLIDAGQAVKNAQPLVSVMPAGARLEAQLDIPSRAVGFIAPGDTVLLRFQAFPYQKFGHQRGRVTRVSRSAIQSGGPAATLSSEPVEPFYRVRVALADQSVMAYGKHEPLLPGMLLDADILGDRRHLYEWLLEPLYSLRSPQQ